MADCTYICVLYVIVVVIDFWAVCPLRPHVKVRNELYYTCIMFSTHSGPHLKNKGHPQISNFMIPQVKRSRVKPG